MSIGNNCVDEVVVRMLEGEGAGVVVVAAVVRCVVVVVFDVVFDEVKGAPVEKHRRRNS